MDINELLELNTKETIATDPHHGGINHWLYKNGKFFHKSENSSKWVEVKKTHPTPARIRMLYSLLPKPKKDKLIVRILKYLLNKAS